MITAQKTIIKFAPLLLESLLDLDVAGVLAERKHDSLLVQSARKKAKNAILLIGASQQNQGTT